MAGRLSYGTALRIAMRELRSSRAKFAFVILSVAVGVAALTGVRGFSASFRRELLLQARSIMAADVSARTVAQPTPREQAELDRISAERGVERTQVIEMLSMASGSTAVDPVLVAIKAVDPAKYPFYGSVMLAPKMPLTQALGGNNIAVGDDLLLRLHARVGDEIQLGSCEFRIAATVVNEPDRLSGMFAAGPRVLMSESELESTGLVVPFSHVSRRFLFKLAPQANRAASDAAVAKLKDEVETALPEAMVEDYREANPAVTRALDGATGLLSLMSLVALVLGAVGVAMAMRSHLQQHMETIAVMKSLGATSTQVMKIYVAQTLLLGLCGGVAGALLGLGVQLALPLFLERLLHMTPGFRLDVPSFALGVAAGLVTTLLFTLPPLLDIRAVRPVLILRRAVEQADDPFVARLRSKLRASALQLVATLLLLCGLAALAWAVSDSRVIGGWFAAGLAAILLVLLLTSAGVLAALRRFLRGTRMALPPVLRHGLANLYRPGNPSAALLAALGLGVMQMTTMLIVQHGVVGEMRTSLAEKLPNIFLIDVAPDEVAGVRALLEAQSQVSGQPEFVPAVQARLVAINGVAADALKLKHVPKRELRSMNLTWGPSEDAPPPGDKVVAGQWWSAVGPGAHPVVAVEEHEAKRLGVKPGSVMSFAVEDQQLTATVVATYSVDSEHAYGRADFVLPKAALAGMPAIWYGGVHCDPNATGVLRRVLYQHYPTITVIDVAATLELVRQVIAQVVDVIAFLAGFSIFAGVVILAGAIAGTRYRRIREVVVLKTLGATRARIATIFSVEFAVLGAIAGLVGLVFANLLGRVLLDRVLHFDYTFQPGMNAVVWVLAALLAVAAGWAASWRVLGQKPLEVLREE